MAARYCFVPDSKEVFIICSVIGTSSDNTTLTLKEVSLSGNSNNNNNRTLTSKASDVIPIVSMQELDSPPSDLIKLIHVNRPAILHTLRTRFLRDCIYTSIGSILVALNPFKWIPNLYDEANMVSYNRGETNLSDAPHVFAVSHEAFQDLHLGMNQSLIIR